MTEPTEDFRLVEDELTGRQRRDASAALAALSHAAITAANSNAHEPTAERLRSLADRWYELSTILEN